MIQNLPLPFKASFSRELIPIKRIYLERRDPRICILGASKLTAEELFAGLGAGYLTAKSADRSWTQFQNQNHATVYIFDARNYDPKSDSGFPNLDPAPDIVMVFADNGASFDIGLANPLRHLPSVPVFNLSVKSLPQKATSGVSSFSFSDNAWQELLCASLPLEAQLEFARLLSAKRAQAYIASTLLKSFGAVSGAIGMQPIPLADMPLLFSIQAAMVALIVHTSGRPANIRLASEFLTALGMSAGAGFLFRETTRALLRFIPLWGNAVSGIIAGTGTYAIGRAAIAYFIDDSPLIETRQLFLSLMKPKKKPNLE